MRNKKLPEFTFLLEQFFTEYMPLSSGLSPNTVRSYKHSFRLLFQYIHQVKKKEAGEILFRDLDYETVDGFLRWIETERGCSVSTRNLRLSALASFAAYAQNRNFEATTVFANAVRRVPVKKKAKAVVEQLRSMKLKEAARKVEDGIEETLTYCDFPGEHWTRIRTNNVIERLNREIRRRTRVVGSFPDGNSALMLVCARLRHVAGTQWGNKKYMNMKHLEAALEDASIAG